MSKAALITGGAKRIGAAIALRLAKQGYDIAIHYNNSSTEATATAKQIEQLGCNVALFKADFLDSSSWNRLIPQVYKRFPELCLLINNASLFEKNRISETDTQQWQRMFSVNLEAPFFISQAFYKFIGKGHIINLLDSKIKISSSLYATYTLSKKGLAAFTEMAAKEFAPQVRVNGIAPSYLLAPDHQDPSIQLPETKDFTVDSLCDTVCMLENSNTTGQIIYGDSNE